MTQDLYPALHRLSHRLRPFAANFAAAAAWQTLDPLLQLRPTRSPRGPRDRATR
jgi:hypothetical protein